MRPITAKLKEKNKGFTLIELIIAMAIASIVIGFTTYFMASSLKSYRKANDELTLQLEGQTILNQLHELIIESYNVKFDESKELLTVYQKDYTYYIKKEKTSLIMLKKQNGEEVGIRENWVLFGEYIDDFYIVDTGSNNNNAKISISLHLIKNEVVYKMKDSTITLRNKIRTI